MSERRVPTFLGGGGRMGERMRAHDQQLADAARIVDPGRTVVRLTGYPGHAAGGDGDLEPGMHVMTRPSAPGTLATRLYAMVNGG